MRTKKSLCLKCHKSKGWIVLLAGLAHHNGTHLHLGWIQSQKCRDEFSIWCTVLKVNAHTTTTPENLNVKILGVFNPHTWHRHQLPGVASSNSLKFNLFPRRLTAYKLYINELVIYLGKARDQGFQLREILAKRAQLSATQHLIFTSIKDIWFDLLGFDLFGVL